MDIMLSNVLEVWALRETLWNQAIRDAVKDIDIWRNTQRTLLIDGLISNITGQAPDPESLARKLDSLNPRIDVWVTTIRSQQPSLKW